MKKHAIIFSLLISVHSANAYAAENKVKTVDLDTVTVVATRTEKDILEVPSMVTVIDADESKNRAATKVSDLFRNEAGIEFGGGPVRSAETPSIRGFDADSILVTVDGRRQNFESQHSSKFFSDPSLIKRVEVVKGPNSAAYGSGAIGGVIAFETKDAADFLEPGQTEGMQVSLTGQSANHEYGEVLTGYKVADDLDMVASIIRRDSEKIHLNNDTDQRSDDGLTSGLAKITYDISEDSQIKFDISSFYNTAEENANPATNDPTQDNLVEKDIFSHQAGVTYNYNPDKLVDFTAKLYYVNTAIDEEVVEPTTLTAIGDELTRDMRTLGFNADNSSIVSLGGEDNHIFSYGLEVFQNKQDGDDSDSGNNASAGGGRPGVPDAESLTAGTYIQDEISYDISDRVELVLTPGLRFDYYNNEAEAALPDDTEYRLSPKFGTTFNIQKNYHIFGNYAEAFRAPNLTELYASGTHFTVDIPGPTPPLNNTFVQNPYLKPETSRTFELGGGFEFNDLSEKNDELRVKASRYITRASDYIEGFVTGPNFGSGACPSFPFAAPGCNFGTTGFRNVDSANIWGYELTSLYENSLIESGLNLSYVSAENARNGQFLSTKQPLVVASHFGFKFDNLDSTIGYTGKYVDGLDKALIDTSDPNFTHDYRRGGFATHGVYISYEPSQLKNLSLDFAIDNIFDKKYRQPGSEIYDYERNYKLRVTYKW